MESSFRKSMTWLHTWAGIVISALLFAIFWTGTLSVFDREIDRWMMPMTRLQVPATPVSLDGSVRPLLESLALGAVQWNVTLPTERVPVIRLNWRDAEGNNFRRNLDPATGAVLASPGTFAGTGFIYPFHYRLHIRFMDIGYWLVGFVTMALLVAIVSGVVIHKKIFRDFFTFRPRKRIQRAALDLHNLTGVLALPFHFVIGLSGLVILFAVYFPSGWQAAYEGKRQTFSAEASDVYKRAKAGTPGSLSSLDAMLWEAQRQWGAGEPSSVRVWYPGDANGYVEVRRSYEDRVTRDAQVVYFDASSGVMLSRSALKPVKTVQSYIAGLHYIQFEHWTLRWLYFVAGLAGCVMIATGLLIWLAARRKQHAELGLSGVRIVEVMSVGSVTGIVAATLVFFIVNRILPLDAMFFGVERESLEMRAFFCTWLLSFIHAGWRARRAWVEQCAVLAILALVAVLLNWITTGDHLLHTLRTGLYGVAGMDALLLLTAVAAWWASRKLQLGEVKEAKFSETAPSNVTPGREDYA